ncbi:Uncharacterised protein [Mycobacteroides abscessus subsp. abscessus]|nr:Uncharacterised protein [Mycobacteroides abscessus subsp. abscessus]SKU96640.1 Uncharacterised protein [Mycobacteroides abscessus subsp. abscessus]
MPYSNCSVCPESSPLTFLAAMVPAAVTTISGWAASRAGSRYQSEVTFACCCGPTR